MNNEIRVSIFTPESPWPSIAHALEFYDGLPRVVVVPVAPAPSFCVDGVTVQVYEAVDAPGVVCDGRQEVDEDAKALWLAKARKEIK